MVVKQLEVDKVEALISSTDTIEIPLCLMNNKVLSSHLNQIGEDAQKPS